MTSTGTASASIGVSGSGNTRTVTLTSITGDGTLGINIASGTATDTAGNLAPASGPSATFTVDNTAPSITGTLSASGTYDNALSTYTITASGSPVSFSASGLPSGLSVDTGNGQITGTPLATGNFNITIGATDAAGNLGTATLSLSVGQKPLTVIGVTASNKSYDGGTSATLGFGSASLLGVRPGDTVSLATGSASGAFADANVGTGKTVTISGLSLSGSSSPNYTFNQPTTTADITPASLTVSGVTASNKPYDGNANASLGFGSANLVGIVGGDTVTLTTGSASGAFDNEHAGTGKTVTVSGLSLSGTDSGNYSITQPTTTADITAAGLTVTGVTASDKTYDGNTSVALGFGSASLGGVIGDDTVSLVTGSATGAFVDANVGTGKTVSVSGLALSGTDSGNYSLTQPTASASITAATLTVTADGKTRAYGFANPTLTASITGYVNGETSAVLSGAPELSTDANAASTPGAYTITAAIGTLSAGNYTFAFADGTLTVRLQEIADWEEENFTALELEDPLVSGPDADPDFDGITNLYEYAFGTDPKDISSGPDPLVYTGTFAGGGTLNESGQPITRTETIPVNNTRVLFVRRVPSLTSDITYTPQFSSNGIAWVNSSSTPTILAQNGLYQVVSIPYPSTTGGKRTRFYRIEADVTH